MKKNYNQPAVEVTLLASMSLMQSASSAGGGSTTDLDHLTITTDDQW